MVMSASPLNLPLNRSVAPPVRPARKRWFKRFFAVAVGFSLLSPPSAAVADDWTNVEGTATIEGDFLGLWEDRVVLRRTDGRRVAIPMNKLNASSRFQAEELAKKRQEYRQQRIDELNSGAGEELSIRTPAPTIEYQTLAADADLQEMIEHFGRQMNAGHIRVLWDSLPASYQADLAEVTRMMGEQWDGPQYAAYLRLARQFAVTMDKQKNFVFGYPKMLMVPPEILDVIGKAYNPVVGILHEMSDPNVFSAANLKNQSLDEIIAAKNASIGPHVAALLRLVPKEQNPLIGLVDGSGVIAQTTSDTTGTISYTDASGQALTENFVKVEGKWLPEAMVNQWKQEMGKMREQIVAISPQMLESSAASALAVTQVNGVLVALEYAETQEEFNAIIDQLIDPMLAQIMPPMNRGGGMAGGMPGAMPGGMPGAMPGGMPGMMPGGGAPNIGGPGSIITPGGAPGGGQSGPPGASPADVSN